MSQFVRAIDAQPAARFESLLLRIRWLLLLLAVLVAWIDSNGEPFGPTFIGWLAGLAIYNVVIWAILHFVKAPSNRLPVVTLIGDMVFFGALPYAAESNANLLAFFSIYPALTASIRFGPTIGLIVAGVLALPIEARDILPIFTQRSLTAVSAGLPIAVLVAATAMIGYLAQHEREAAIKQAVGELEDLRHAMAGAKMLYATTDTLSSTTNYAPVLEAMLEAGVKGLPPGRRDDSLPVGIALLFDDQDSQKPLKILASRHLDRRDADQRLAGKHGILAEALQSGEPVIFDDVMTDPELGTLSALARCRGGVCYPLQAGLDQYGVVVLAGPAPRHPSDQHLELMRAFTNQAALAFQNAKLYADLRTEHDQVINTENEMRQKLARDLHDGPTQKVAALVMQLDFINKLLDHDLAMARTEIEKARAVAQQTVKEIRTTLFTLRPLALETRGLSAALEGLCERLRSAENVPITIEPGNFGMELDLNIATTVFSIIDEAVGNARKHAAGTPILVQVSRQKNTLVALVQDQGPGFDLDKVVSSYDARSSLGLQNMRERAKLIDADLRIDSERGRGTRVTLIVPLGNLNRAQAKT